MKRALTGIAAAAVVLGSISPVAFAATTTSGLTKAGQLPIVVNGSVLSNPYEMTGKDSGNTTGFFPVYYFEQALNKIGFTATWDGVTHTFAITAPGVTPSAVAGGVGTGNTTVTVNGTVVKKFNTQAAKDPAASKSAAATTYMPVYYINNVLTALGVNGSFSGQTGLKITGSATTSTAPSLGAINLTGQTQGTGSSSSPAVGEDNANVTASTTLTDANGNPVAGISVTFNVWGSSTAPTVTSSNGTVVSLASGSGDGSSSTSPFEYVATTNASGVASIVLSSSSNVSYTIQAQAPYNNNGVTVTSSKSYIAFGQPGSLVLAPVNSQYGYSTSTSTAGVVPVTATVIPQPGETASDVPVTFHFSNASNVFQSNATGSYLAPISTGTAVVNTDANGQATLYVNALEAGTLDVYATANNVSQSATSDLTWEASGVPSQVANTQTTDIAANTGTNVTISGTVEDEMGNPVANTQVLVSGYDADNSGDFSYVNGSTTTAFPYVGTDLVGADATSAFGQVVTTDANGNFTVTVTDTKAVTQKAYVQVWAIQNGQIVGQGGATANTSPIANYTIDLTANTTTLSALYVDSSETGLISGGTANNEYTSLTGLDYDDSGATDALPIYVGGFAGETPYHPANSTVQYNVSSSGKGFVAAVDGVPLDGSVTGLPNQPSSVIVDVTYGDDGSVSNVTVDGQSIVGVHGTDAGTANMPAGTPYAYSGLTAAQGAFTFVPGNTNVENDTYTITTGSETATVGADFAGGAPSYVENFTPATNIQSGQTKQVTFTVEDSQGNPVANSLATIESADSNDPLWITAVNGVALTTTETTGANSSAPEPTPIPLGSANAQGYGVNIAGVVAYNNGDHNIGVYTNDQGQVTLTLEGSGTSYWNSGVQTFTSSNPVTEQVWSTTKAGTNPWQLWIGNAADTEANATQLGTISAGAGSSTVIGAASQYAVSTTSNSITSATSFPVTISAQDAYGNAVTTDTGSVTLGHTGFANASSVAFYATAANASAGTSPITSATLVGGTVKVYAVVTDTTAADTGTITAAGAGGTGNDATTVVGATGTLTL